MDPLTQDNNKSSTSVDGLESLEVQITGVGVDLSAAFTRVISDLPDGPRGTQAVSNRLGVDKVSTSRLLKALRYRDPMGFVHHAPGPEPLRRVIRAAESLGVAQTTIDEALVAVTRFENLIRNEMGDRGALNAVISTWLPEAKREFEVRARQSAYKAMCHLKGVQADMNLGTVLLHPSDDGEHIDVVWVMALLGLRRFRPGVSVKLTTRRSVIDAGPRRPLTLEGLAFEDAHATRLDQFCDNEPANIELCRVGDAVHYVLAGGDSGPKTGSDLVMAELNRAELPIRPEENRQGYMYIEVTPPSRYLVFDVIVHEDLYAGIIPDLYVYDTAFEGVTSVNDRARDVDRINLIESIEHLGRGTNSLRLARIPQYPDILRHVFDSMKWNPNAFRSYRCASDYPLYGTQVAMAFGGSH